MGGRSGEIIIEKWINTFSKSTIAKNIIKKEQEIFFLMDIGY